MLNAFATIFMFLSPPYAEEINVERWCKNERSNKKVGREMAEHAMFSLQSLISALEVPYPGLTWQFVICLKRKWFSSSFRWKVEVKRYKTGPPSRTTMTMLALMNTEAHRYQNTPQRDSFLPNMIWVRSKHTLREKWSKAAFFSSLYSQVRARMEADGKVGEMLPKMNGLQLHLNFEKVSLWVLD